MSKPTIGNGEPGNGKCQVCGCACRLGHLMCGEHWRRVPFSLQAKVYAALTAFTHDGDLASLRSAQDAAVQAVVAKGTQ